MSVREIDIEGLKALDAKATPGPWLAKSRNMGTDDSDWSADDAMLGWEIEPPPESMRGQFQRGADAHLIAAARNALPSLLDAAAVLAEIEKMAGESEREFLWPPLPKTLQWAAVELLAEARRRAATEET